MNSKKGISKRFNIKYAPGVDTNINHNIGLIVFTIDGISFKKNNTQVMNLTITEIVNSSLKDDYLEDIHKLYI